MAGNDTGTMRTVSWDQGGSIEQPSTEGDPSPVTVTGKLKPSGNFHEGELIVSDGTHKVRLSFSSSPYHTVTAYLIKEGDTDPGVEGVVDFYYHRGEQPVIRGTNLLDDNLRDLQVSAALRGKVLSIIEDPTYRPV